MASHLFGSRTRISMPNYLFSSMVSIASIIMTLRYRDVELFTWMFIHLSVPYTLSRWSTQSVKELILEVNTTGAFSKIKTRLCAVLLTSAQYNYAKFGPYRFINRIAVSQQVLPFQNGVIWPVAHCNTLFWYFCYTTATHSSRAPQLLQSSLHI